MALYVGTSGWAYREWKPDFYPAELPQKQFLSHYGSVLSACEINATFYRLQRPETFTGWAEATPQDFRFAIKAHRRLTHSKSFAPVAEQKDFLVAFLESLKSLEARLGVVLFQFPPYRHRNDEAFELLLAELPAGLTCAFEFRHESWNDPEIEKRCAAAGGTICISETAGSVPDALPAGPIGYVRLRSERYTPEAREGWRALLERESAEREVYAFAKHEGIPAGDPFGGVGLAQWLVSVAHE